MVCDMQRIHKYCEHAPCIPPVAFGLPTLKHSQLKETLQEGFTLYGAVFKYSSRNLLLTHRQ